MMDKTLKALHLISTPFLDNFVSGPVSTQNSDSLLRNIVSTCVTLLEDDTCGKSMAENSGPPTSSWGLVSTSLHLLLRLHSQVEEAEALQPESEKSIQVLSIQAQRDFEACVELLIGFGLIPYLLPGVGVPQRVRPPKNPAAIQLFLRDDIDLPPLIQFHRLAQVVDGLVAISTQNPSLAALIIPKHTPDILAALFQICYPPIAPPSQSEGKERPGALSQAEYDHVMAIRGRFTSTHLANFMASPLLPKNVFLPSLFLIGEKPKWMAEACTRFIEKELVSQGGVILIASTLILESSPSNAWSLAKIVANLMRICLNKAKISQTEDDYKKMFEGMCSQCLQMISPMTFQREIKKKDVFTTTRGDVKSSSSSLQDGNNKELTRIGLFCSLVLMDIDCSTSRRMVWNLLFRPIYQLIPSHQQEMTDNDGLMTSSVSVDIGQVIDVVDVCEGLLSLILPTGSCLPLHVFQPVWSLLWEVYVLARNYLERRKVTEPEVSQLALLLKNKIEPVLILMLEVLSSEAGERLDLNTATTSKTIPNNTCSGGGNNKVSGERSTYLSEFCVSLLFVSDEHDWMTVTRAGGNSLQLMSSHCENDDYNHSSQGGRIKIARVLNPKLQPFEVLADSCAIFCSVLKQEEDRLSTIASLLFRQLLTFQQNEEEKNEKQNTNIHHHPRQETTDKVSSLRKESSFPKDSSSTLTQLEPILHRSELTELNVASARKFLSLKLLEELGKDDKTVGSCLNSPDYRETLLIVELVLGRLVRELKASSETGESYEFSQTIIFALGLLGTIVETGISINQFGCSTQERENNKPTTTNSKPVDNVQDDEFWNELQRFTPHLAEIVDSTDLRLLSLGLNSMADNILTSIRSRGVEGLAPGQSEKVPQQSALERALTDVASPLLPLKGHGLLQLKRLIEARDPETLGKDSLLLNIFQTQLAHEDSYIYLMTVQGLAALGLKFHGIVVPILIQEYVNVHSDEGEGGRSKMYASCTPSEAIDCRMKIGEVLVRVIQGLGQFAPHYRVPLCNALFRVGREEEPLLRASALSNLGELCHLLKFSLGSILTEVWVNVEWILNWEKDLSVRRAALHLLVLLLKGVEKGFEPADLLEDVQIGEHLRDVRRLLTRLQEREPDPVSKTHAQLALSELEGIVAKLLGPMSTHGELSYKIRVLGAIE